MKKAILDLCLKYQNKWVGLEKKTFKIIAVGDSVVEVENKMKDNDYSKTVITFITSPDQYLSPYGDNKI